MGLNGVRHDPMGAGGPAQPCFDRTWWPGDRVGRTSKRVASQQPVPADGTDAPPLNRGVNRPLWRGNCRRGIFEFVNNPALNIKELSPEDRLRLIEEPWDSLNETPGSVLLTNPQREELDRRFADLERTGPEGIPWDQVLQQIRSGSERSHRYSNLLLPPLQRASPRRRRCRSAAHRGFKSLSTRSITVSFFSFSHFNACSTAFLISPGFVIRKPSPPWALA